MTDNERVIKGLEHCQKSYCNGCPYAYDLYCIANLTSDALVVLKKQPDIVRCENCKFAEKQLFGAKESEYKCTLSESWGLYDFHNKDWYCPDGKRRETND